MGALCLLFALSAALLAQTADEHKAPVASLSEPDSPPRGEAQTQALLSEMWQRRILSTESRRWAPEDVELLDRMRSAERRGAVTTLRRNARALASLTVSIKVPGSKFPSIRLTREGYDKWIGLRSLEAIEFFERKGADARWVFQLVDLSDHRLFDGGGRLTSKGDYVYDLASANLPVWWKVPQTGEVFGTRPPPRP